MLVFESMERLLRSVFVAFECNLLRIPHNGSYHLHVNVEDQGVLGCRASKGGRLLTPVMAVLANSRLVVGDCKVLEVQLPIESVAVRASQHIYIG
jgi:hypothetical protein